MRLRSHVSQLRGMLASDQPMGRKMDFLIQELNRESNTIGSKCSNLDIARIVVDLKGEVEKIRSLAIRLPNPMFTSLISLDVLDLSLIHICC